MIKPHNTDRFILSLVITICTVVVLCYGIGAKAQLESQRLKQECVKANMDAGLSIQDSRKACRK